MQREPHAYLADILESCDAIDAAVSGMRIDGYLGNRLVRSSVEREFTIIGEAVLALSRKVPEVFDAITGARRIVDFRNRLTHEYPTVDDELVWGLVKIDLQVLRSECESLVAQLDSAARRQV